MCLSFVLLCSSPTSAHLNTSFESDGSEDKTIYFTTGEERQETFNPAEERQDAHTRGEDRQETCTERSIVQEQEGLCIFFVIH